MQPKTRELELDAGPYSDSRIIPYTGNVISSSSAAVLAQKAAWGLSWEDYFLHYWTFGHPVFGLDLRRDYSSSAIPVGQQRFWSTDRMRPLFNNVSNYKDRSVVRTYTFGDQYKPAKWRWFCRGAGVLNATATHDPILKHTPYDWSNAQRTAWAEMQPRFEGDISMFNFLLELKDLRELIKLLKMKPLRKLRNFFRRKRKLFDPTKPIAEAHLLNEFAIKPLLSDIYTITCQINEVVQQAQSEFAEAGLGRNSRHWSQTAVIDDTGFVPKTYSLYSQGTGVIEWQKFTATMEYSYAYSARSSIDAFMRYWGLTPSWEAIWNAIPFSFIVDYFIKVGNSIAAMEKDPNVHLDLHQYCESILSKRQTGSFFIRDRLYEKVAVIDGRVCTDDYILVSGRETSLYTRRVAAPNRGAVLPSVKLLSSKQALNLAALLRCFV
jgi:hypothetical protein